MSRTPRTRESRPLRITHVYGPSLKWTKLPGTARLTRETGLRLRREGYTMVRTRAGWRMVREISLLRFADALDH
ncbi:MAG: alternative tryptophan synthase beta-subunit [Microbacterium enclense]